MTLLSAIAAQSSSVRTGAALAAMFFANNNQESSMDVIPFDTVNPNRFQACGRVTSFLGFETVLFRRVHGRFGGDAGNRKRREELRHENDIEHRIRVRNEKRAVQQAIVDGLEEYSFERAARIARAKPKASTYESRKRDLRAEDDSSKPRRQRRDRSGEQLPENLIRQGRTGHIVEVVRITKRKFDRTALVSDLARPRLTSDQVRVKLGLPPRSVAA